MRVATAEEAQFANSTNAYRALPWAAGKPGSMFDKPEDILFSNGNMERLTKQFLRDNDITFYDYHSSTPRADPQQMQSYIQSSGCNYQIQQVGFEILLHAGSDNRDLTRCLDLLEPLQLPQVVQLNRFRSNTQTLVGQYWQLRGRDCNASGIPGLFKSGDTWLVVFTRYHNTNIEYTARDRADALAYCMVHYAKGVDREEEEDQED